MAEQDFQPFATAAGANVISQADFLASNWLPTGFSEGIAYSDQLNKVWRQSSIISSAIAQAISDVLAVDVIDDGTIATIEANFLALFRNLNRLYAVDTGTVNSLVITLPTNQAPASMTAIVGVPVVVKASHTTTNTATLNINGLGATAIVNPDASALAPGQIVAGGLATLIYDGTKFELISSVTGPLTAKVNTWTYGQTWVANGLFQGSVTVNGSVTGASMVSTGGMSAAAGAIITGYDAGGAQLRTVGGNYGMLIRNDGVNLSLLQTASGNQYGTFNAFRPLSWNFTNGAVTIDGTGAGAFFGGNVTTTGAVISNTAITTTGQATAQNLVTTGYDSSNSANMRIINAGYGIIFRNDGINFYLLQTASGASTGTWNLFRPFSWNLSSGTVTLDGTGAGIFTGGALAVGTTLTTGGAASINGTISSNGNITAFNGKFRAGTGAFNSGDPNAVPILNDWFLSFSGTNNGWSRQPNGLIEQTVGIGVPCGNGFTTTNVTLPTTFPNACLDAIISYLGNSPPTVSGLSVQPISTSQVAVTVYNTLVGSVGVVIRARGN
jgi:hypothetical protein